MQPENMFLTFLRHAESVGNMQNRFQGQADFPLTDRGRVQARALAASWKAEGTAFDRVCSSPLLRARETAEIVCEGSGLSIEFDPDWMEINNGALAGLTPEEGRQVAPRPEPFTPYTRWGGSGESRWELFLRAGRNIQKLMDRPVERTLVVAHGGILNMAVYTLLGISPQAASSGPRFVFDNTTFATFLYEGSVQSWRLLRFNDRSALINLAGS